MRKLTQEEMEQTRGGDVTLAAVMAVMAAAIVAVVLYRLFMSEKGMTSLPGGFKFQWE